MKIIKLTLISIFSLPLTSPSILASENDTYWYGYAWGGMFSACLAYEYGDMSKKDAKGYIQIFYDIGSRCT